MRTERDAAAVVSPYAAGRYQLNRLLSSIGRYRLVLSAIVLGQAVWLGLLIGHGWFYQDDFTFMSQAVGHPLNWAYLSQPVNSHLTPGLRFQFWLLQRFAPFNNEVTLLSRVILQCAATVLLAKLLELLVGRRPGIVLVIAAYAFSPILVPGILWYAASTNLLPSQIFAILTVRCHVLYTLTRRTRYAIGAGASLLGVAAFWEKSATIALTLPILSLIFLHDGRPRDRLRASLRNWLGWVLTALPFAAFLSYFVANGYGGGGKIASLLTVGRLTALEWFRSLAPSVLGGPWQWFSGKHVYESFSSAPIALEVATQVLVVALLAVGIRRAGFRVLGAWLIPLVTISVGMALVAAGRYQLFGGLLDRAYTYAFDSAVPLTIAIGLSTMPSSPSAITSRLTAHASPPPLPASVRNGAASTRLMATATVCVVASSMLSGITYGARWADNPSQQWVNALRRNALAAGPSLNVFNTGVPVPILPIISEARHISDVLAVLNIPASFNSSSSDPRIVTDSGAIVPATLLSVATARTSGPNPLCNDLIAGVTARTQPLSGRPNRNEWFLQLQYFQQRPSVISVTLVDDKGRDISPVTGSRLVLPDKLGQVYLQFPYTTPRALRVRSSSESTNLCLTRALVGYPFAGGS